MVSDVNLGAHANTCKSIIESIGDSLDVDIIDDSQFIGFSSIGYICIDSSYSLVCRPTTGLTDARSWRDGGRILDFGSLMVMAHGSNDFVYLDNPDSIGNIVAIRAKETSYGNGVEFYIPDYTQESYATAFVTGHFADLGYRFDTTYTAIRSIARATASGGGIWVNDTLGYGTPDWDAVEDSLITLIGE